MAEKLEIKPIRFGIIGCGQIGKKMARAICLARNALLWAIGSRSMDKAERFAAQMEGFSAAITSGVKLKLYGSYEEVVNDTCVDAVYVPLPTSMHLRWAVLAAEKGKHVLLEKPTALHVDDLDRIVEACGKSGVQLMDGTMWMHHPRTTFIHQLLADPTRFGQLTSVHSSSTYAGSPEFLENDIRVKPDLDSLGALGDAGWYCIRAILWAFNYQLPKTIAAISAEFNKSGVILSCAASFLWNDIDGKVATFYSSFLANESMDLNLYGTVGTIHLRDFIIPFREDSASFLLSSRATELPTGWDKRPEEVSVTLPLPQEALMVEEFARLVASIRDTGCLPDPKWPEISRKTQLVLDAVKKSVELGFKPVEL